MFKSFLFIIVFVSSCLFISGCNSYEEESEPGIGSKLNFWDMSFDEKKIALSTGLFQTW